MNILIVDDEKEIADLVELVLQKEGYGVLKFYDAEDALRAVSERDDIELAVLDIMMPKVDGFTLLSLLRQRHNFPVIMLSAKVEDFDKIRGLDLGADDYITKPFNPMELVARVRAQLRRYRRYDTAALPSDTISIRGLQISKGDHSVLLFGEPVTLTPTEFQILYLLCENAGRVVSSETIFETVWQEKYLDSNNTVVVHIRRLREKLNEPPKKPKFIKTVWGVGYKVES